MTRVLLLVMGSLAAVTFASLLLVLIPQTLLPERPFNVPLPPYRATDSPLKPYTDEELLGRRVYIANGCLYCHSQQIRDPTFTNDVDRGWGRPSYPSDYIYDSPALLGTMRTGPDLINVGVRLPDRNWHFVHLYQPRALVPWSIMPAFPYLFEIKKAEEVTEDIVKTPEGLIPSDHRLVATKEAKALVAYLLSLRRDFPPLELKLEQERLRKERGSQ